MPPTKTDLLGGCLIRKPENESGCGWSHSGTRQTLFGLIENGM
jgi:hypothetical protein